jgi:hypothetical protein
MQCATSSGVAPLATHSPNVTLNPEMTLRFNVASRGGSRRLMRDGMTLSSLPELNDLEFLTLNFQPLETD